MSMTKTQARDAIREVWQQRDDVHCISDEEREESKARCEEALKALGG